MKAGFDSTNLKQIGFMNNKWRRRFVTIYEHPDPQTVYTVGISDDGTVTKTIEPKERFHNAISIFPKAYIYE